MNATPNLIFFRTSVYLGYLAIAALLLLHFLSPEFDPSWRMISEYAYGSHGWLLQVFFFAWAASTYALAAGIFPLTGNIWSKIGLFLLLLSGVGELMGGLFDIRHPLHGAAFGLGVPPIPVAAMLIGYYLSIHYPINRRVVMWSSHLTWISVGLLAITMMLFISGLQKAGLFHPESGEAPEYIPADVIAWIGYTNRFMVLCDLAWLIIIGSQLQRVLRRENR
ncbi:MAG: DUF998 domain-containing protein [Bacteroidetes bacterium]|nr:DUF998 domain-containing protein [Bacteroidota bacterium]